MEWGTVISGNKLHKRTEIQQQETMRHFNGCLHMAFQFLVSYKSNSSQNGKNISRKVAKLAKKCRIILVLKNKT